MLRPAGGFGSGASGGRPPVNLEINFVPGSAPNAITQARAEVKALKADLDEIAKHSAWNGASGGGGGFSVPNPVGGGAIPTAPGTTATAVGAAAGRSTVPAAPTVNRGSTTRLDASDAVRDAQRMTEANRALAASAREVATAYVAVNTAAQVGAVRFGQTSGGSFGRGGSSGVNLVTGMPSFSFHGNEVTQAVQEIRDAGQVLALAVRHAADSAYVAANSIQGGGSAFRFGPSASNRLGNRSINSAVAVRGGISAFNGDALYPFMDNTITAGSLATLVGGRGVPMFGGMGLGVAGAAVAGVLGVIAANTPQGTQAIGSAGSWLESVTREEGFAQQFLKSAGRIFGDNSAGPNIIEMYRRDVLGPFVQQADSQAKLERMLRGQSAENAGYQLGQLSSMSSTGIGMDALSAARAQNANRIAQLEDQVWNRASTSPESRFEASEALKAEYQRQLEIKQQELAISQSILDTRIRERDAVEQMVNAQMSQLAGMGRGDLKKLERDFQAMKNGTLELKGANRLAAAGINTPEISQIREQYVRENAPGVSQYLQGMRDAVRASVDRQTEMVADLTTQIGIASDGNVKSMTGLAAAVIKAFDEVNTAQTDMINQIVAKLKNDGVKNSQPRLAPGNRGPGAAR